MRTPKPTLLAFLLPFFLWFFSEPLVVAQSGQRFSFVFMTDVHIKNEPHVLTSYRRAIDSINALEPDFVLSGGDQVFDVMRGNVAKSDSLFQLFLSESARIHAPVHTAVGNHELFGIYEVSPTDHTHPDYKYGMYERYFGAPYYSFSHKGWHIVVLNNLDVEGYKFFAGIDEEQLEWLAHDLAQLPPETPVIMMMHVPIVSVQNQYRSTGGGAGPSVVNKDRLMALIQQHDVRLVLQGHLHFPEDIYVLNRTRFITGGAIAGRPSWRGLENGPRGFLHFQIDGDDLTYRFVAYDTMNAK